MDHVSHEHCPNCGEHRTAVKKMVSTGPQTWICQRCKNRSATAKSHHQVLIRCPECSGVRDNQLPCGGCNGLGSVYVAQAEIVAYVPPAQRVLMEDAKAAAPLEG